MLPSLQAKCYTVSMQTTNVTFDPDTGILFVRLIDGSTYHIVNPVHARAVRERISVGGHLTEEQHFWLQQYRVIERERRKEQVLETLKKCREGLKQCRQNSLKAMTRR